MTILKIENTQWILGLNKIKKIYDLIGPVEQKDTYYEFKTIDKTEFPDLTNYTNSKISPKGMLFPQSEDILKQHRNQLDKTENNTMEEISEVFLQKAIIGIRPCDAKAINTILKLNFDTVDVKDPYWVKRYESVTLIGLACDDPCSTCFCTTTKCGPYNTDGLDAILIPVGKSDYLIKIITEKGDKFVSVANWNNVHPEGNLIFNDKMNSAQKKITSKITSNNLKSTSTLDLYNAAFWDKISFACINCGACTFLCPTCWCFDIQDEIRGKLNVRSKNWDSCMFPIFTVHTTGHNPRKTKTQRFRQRFMHKFKYFIDKYDKGVMCVGCGRCIQNCPVNIDVREVCELMNDFTVKNTNIA